MEVKSHCSLWRFRYLICLHLNTFFSLGFKRWRRVLDVMYSPSHYNDRGYEWQVSESFFFFSPPSSGLSSSYSDGSAHQVGRHRVSGIPRDWILRQNVFISWRHLEVGKCCLRTHPVSSHQAQARLGNWWEDPAELHGCSFPGSARPGGQRGLIDAVLLHNEGPSPRKTAGVNFSTNYFFYTTSVWTKMEIQLHPEFRWYFFARIDNSKKQFGQNSFPPSLPPCGCGVHWCHEELRKGRLSFQPNRWFQWRVHSDEKSV